MAVKGLQALYNLILKDVVKGSGQASGIMSIGGDVRKLADKIFQRYVTAAQKQGVDLDKLSEQELKYTLELNKPKKSKIISADSPEGKGITEMLLGKRGKVIKADFGKPFAEEIVTVERVITDIKKLEPIEAMKEANRVLKGEGRYKSLSKADREKIAMDESVTDHIFERNIEPEDFAQGGRTGLSYLLAEDTNERMPFKMGRRAFLKLMGGIGAGIGALKTGALKLFGKEGATVAKELTQVPINNIEGMPSWFKPLVNKVLREGTEVESGAERVIVHKTKLPESKTDVYVTQQLDTGDVAVDIGMGKHGWSDGYYGQPVRLEYKAAEIIEPDLKTGKGGGKTKEEFTVEEAEFTGGDPENVKFEESTIEKYGDHGSDFSEVERFATGRNVIKDKSGKFKEVETLPTTKKADQLEWARGRAEAEADAAADMADDFASGGLAKMLGE
jgi:hypothetical protein